MHEHREFKGPSMLPGIYLVGFMGCGKTTVGRSLSKKLKWKFIDLDEEIEKRANESINRVFLKYGEQVFRKIESDVLVDQVQLVCKEQARVIALGGGTFCEAVNRDTIKKAGSTVWLDVPLEELWSRVSVSDHRPLANDRKEFEGLYERRLKDYIMADLSISAGSKSPDRVVKEILDFFRLRSFRGIL